MVKADCALIDYHWIKDISHIPKGKWRKNQLWAFKREITSASVTTLFLNKRSRSSSLEHLAVALRDNRTTWKSLFWLWNHLQQQNSRGDLRQWDCHDSLCCSRVPAELGCSKPVITYPKICLLILGFLFYISLMLTQTGSHGSRAHDFQMLQKIILVLNNSFTLVCTSLIFLTQQKLRTAVELSQSCVILQCRKGLCVSFSLRKKTTTKII